MKIKRISFLILLILIFVLIFPVATAESSQQPGNSYGNIINYGLVAQQGDYFFYSNGFDSWKLYQIKKNDTGKHKISDDAAQYINVSENTIFYSNMSDSWKLYSINFDGSNRVRLNDDHSEYVNVSGDYIYYISVGEGWHIARTSKDGSGKIFLTDDKATGLNATEDWIYYINWSDNRRIYRVKPDGSRKQKLSDDSAVKINLYGNMIYYINESDNNRIYSINIDDTGSSGRKKAGDDSVLQINVYNDQVYYINSSDSNKAYKINTDGSGRAVVRQDSVFLMNITENWIYFCSSYEENPSFIYYEGFKRTSPDGSVLQGEQEMYDYEKAAGVKASISLLPITSQLKLSDKAQVVAARTSYDGLSAAQKALVSNYAVLTAAENKIFELEPKEITSKIYVIDSTNKTLTSVKPGDTVDTILSGLSGGSGKLEVFNSAGIKTTGGKVGTGYKVKLTMQNKVVNEVTVIIRGDVNSDGSINALDLLTVKKYILKQISLNSTYLLSANINKDKSVNALDLLAVKKHILGQIQIKQ